MIATQLDLHTARQLYRRGWLTLTDACRLTDQTETEFLESMFTAAEVAAATDPLITPEKRLHLPPDFKLSVLIPVYNERHTIREILQRVEAVGLPLEMIVVDDGSTDGTRDELRTLEQEQHDNLRIVFHPQNRGKGAAVRTAIEHATGTICLIQDADLEYDPREYFQLLEPIVDGRADAVYGSRFAGGGAHRVHLFWHKLGNQMLTTFSNAMTNLNLTDMETCYKVVRTDLLKSLPLRANRFELEPELTAKLAKARARIYEVPISYSGRDYAEGKKIGWRDGVQAVWCIFKYRFFN
ncbi:MAG TPA: glycosyltransferase family 2 protein [Blastocatellia bacterium]|nr:glycosyltransferase family 2 protein [Blastocatellia bacterium]